MKDRRDHIKHRKTPRDFQSGMSLVEVMIVITIMGLVGLGTASLMKNMVSIQKRTDLKTTAGIIKSRLEEYIRNETAWDYTVANVPELQCIREKDNRCDHNDDNPSTGAFITGNSTSQFPIYDEEGVVYLKGAGATPNGGFDRDGEPCNAFSDVAGGGNNDCPFRYYMAAWFFCPNGQPTCERPEVTVKGELLFNPRDKSATNDRLNTDDYRISIKLQQKVRSESFRIVYKDPNPFNTVDNLGGGNCNPPGPETGLDFRPFSNEEYDDGDNVQLVDLVGSVGYQSFRVEEGTYECKVTTQSFEATEGYQVILEDWTSGAGTNPIPAGGGYSGLGATVHSTLPFQLALLAPATFRLRHICQVSNNRTSPLLPGNPPAEYDLGIPVPDYGVANPSVYTSVTCTRSS